MVGCPLAAATVFKCRVEFGWWIVPHFAFGAHFDCGRWDFAGVTQRVQRTPASWLPAVDKSRGSQWVEVQRVWGDL